MKGQKMLKVCSIFMIIGGAINLLSGILYIAGILEPLNAVIYAAPLVMAVLQLGAGIIGIKTAGMPSVNKVKASLVLGLLTILIALAYNIYTITLSATNIPSLLLGLILPILYLLGIIQFKNALQELLKGD